MAPMGYGDGLGVGVGAEAGFGVGLALCVHEKLECSWRNSNKCHMTVAGVAVCFCARGLHKTAQSEKS